MFNLFQKIIFSLKRPSVILITGEGRACANQAVFQVLKLFFEIKKSLIFESNLSEPKEVEKFIFFLKKSKLPILVVTHMGDIPPDKDFFAAERENIVQIRKLAENLPRRGFLILNFDDETVRELKNKSHARSLTYGFQERADFRVSDININLNGTNFKINYEGNIIPFWLKNLFGKEQIYSALAAASVGVVKGINLVETSQSLRNYESLQGKMKLIKGIKDSSIIDDSESATLFSMLEALDVFGRVKIEGRKIAVLGDVLGIGEYTIEAHESIGEKVAKVANLLFTVGARARFIAEGSKNKGMLEQNIFQFDRTEEAKKVLQNEIKKGDLILVDGSQEMKMGEIVKEIKA